MHIKGRQVHKQMWEICLGIGPSEAEGLQNGIWEIKLGELFGAVLGKCQCYWVKEHSSVPARVLKRVGLSVVGLDGSSSNTPHITKSNMLLQGCQFQ